MEAQKGNQCMERKLGSLLVEISLAVSVPSQLLKRNYIKALHFMEWPYAQFAKLQENILNRSIMNGKSPSLCVILVMLMSCISLNAEAAIESVEPIIAAPSGSLTFPDLVFDATMGCNLIPIGGYGVDSKGTSVAIVRYCGAVSEQNLADFLSAGWHVVNNCIPANSNFTHPADTCNYYWPVYLLLAAKCPVPTENPAVPYTINPTTNRCERPEQSTCPVTALTALPFNDACSQALENLNSTQAQKDAACGTLSQAMQNGNACLSERLSRTNNPATATPIPMRITGGIRSLAYQAHLREIWDRMEDLVELEDDPVKHAACATRRAEIAAEKGCDNAGPCTSCYAESATQRSHCLNGRPARPNPNDAQHTRGNAIDVSRTRTIIPLQAALAARRPPETVQQFLDASSSSYPNGCNLNWGGTFTNNYDPVHLYAR